MLGLCQVRRQTGPSEAPPLPWTLPLPLGLVMLPLPPSLAMLPPPLGLLCSSANYVIQGLGWW